MCSSSYLDKNQESLGIRWYHWNHECNLHIGLKKTTHKTTHQNQSQNKAQPIKIKQNTYIKCHCELPNCCSAFAVDLQSVCHLLTLTAWQWPAPLEVWLTLQGFIVTQSVAGITAECHQCSHVEIIPMALSIHRDPWIQAVV